MGAARAQNESAWAIPSPSSCQPIKRAEWDGSSGNDLPALETPRELCPAGRPDDGDLLGRLGTLSRKCCGKTYPARADSAPQRPLGLV
jgi:hypothetical protein